MFLSDHLAIQEKKKKETDYFSASCNQLSRATNVCPGRQEEDPPPSPSLMHSHGWNMDLIAGAPAATVNHKDHCK